MCQVPLVVLVEPIPALLLKQVHPPHTAAGVAAGASYLVVLVVAVVLLVVKALQQRVRQPPVLPVMAVVGVAEALTGHIWPVVQVAPA